MWENENILYPTGEEREKSIRRIVTEGMPPRCSLRAALWRAWSCMGIRGLFCGVEECVILALLGAGMMWLCAFGAYGKMIGDLSLPVFMLSPAFYAALRLLAFWKEQMAGTYEQLMVCRLSLRQMTALRTLLIGGISLLMCGGLGVGVWLWSGEAYLPFRMLALSSASLFLFAWLSLAVEWRLRLQFAYLVTPAVWIGGSIGLVLCENARTLLTEVPTVVFMLAAVLFAELYWKQLKKYYFREKEGAFTYAVG